MNFLDWVKNWLAVYKVPYLKKSSIDRIQTIIKKHIPQELAQMELSTVKAFDIDKTLSACSLSRTRKYMYYVFTSALKKAYKLDLIKNDITLKIDPVRHKQKQGKALTIQEQNFFINSIKGSKYKNLFMFYLLTGCRRCEALSLTWSDIDFTNKIIFIKGTKTTASERTFFILPQLENVLKEQYKLTNKYILVFPFNKDNISHAFKKHCKTHKLHDLRHTFITRCAECGININVTKTLVGHSDINTTLRIYTHISTDFERQEFNKFNIEKT